MISHDNSNLNRFKENDNFSDIMSELKSENSKDDNVYLSLTSKFRDHIKVINKINSIKGLSWEAE